MFLWNGKQYKRGDFAMIESFSDDGIVELLEMKNKGFNIGVQWHPELITEKKEQNLIFKKFIEHIINKNS